MSLWSRIANLCRVERLSRDIDEELRSHVEEAVEHGRDPAEARRAFGSALRHRESSRDMRLIPWLDSLRADLVFGWRQLLKNKLTSAAAVLSLALGIGSCTSAFRLIDALLLRPLPIAPAERLYDVYRQEIGWDGKPGTFDGWAYPAFEQMRDAVRNQAELIAVSYAERTDLTYGSQEDIEKATVQYVSGDMFRSFGLRPALGRLLSANDDAEPGAHPYAVLSHDYWSRRFGADPNAVGRSLVLGNIVYRIIGVAEDRFTGTEPGTVIDIFLPAMMYSSVRQRDVTWHRTLAVLTPGTPVEPLRQRLDRISLAFESERAKAFVNMSNQSIDQYLHQKVVLERSPSGVSGMQQENRRSLIALGVLVALVLLIACANVANLMTAQASARVREMALRVSIGAGRGRLLQLVLVESAVLAILAAVIGAMFAWWSAPMVVSMINSPDSPARVLLPADARVIGFGLALTIGVMLLFGLSPALRASGVRPAITLKGGDDPHSRRRLMHALIAAQVCFCFLVLFVAGLFVTTFNRLSHQSIGFSAERILTLDTIAQRPQATAVWDGIGERLRSVPGIEEVALAGWPLLSGNGWNNSVSINGGPPRDDLTYFLRVSPGWVETMRIPLLQGRDFRAGDTYPGAAIVNETFVNRYFRNGDPIGKEFAETQDEGGQFPMRIVGVARDARYRGMRDAIPPIAYVPFDSAKPMRRSTFIVRTLGPNPTSLASTLRREVARARSDFHVSNIRTQKAINQALTTRERLLATLAAFFGVVALVLAGVGLYGVLAYSVLQRRREIGIRMAIGAQPHRIARLVMSDVSIMVLVGASLGLAVGMISVKSIESLLYGVKATDFAAIAVPALAIVAVALLAWLPALIRAVRIDAIAMLRVE